MGFSRQEYQSGLPCTPSEDLPNPRIKPTSPAAPAPQVDSLPLSHQGSPRTLDWIAYPFSRGICPTQGSNPGLLPCRWILYQLSHQGSPPTPRVTVKAPPLAHEVFAPPWPCPSPSLTVPTAPLPQGLPRLPFAFLSLPKPPPHTPHAPKPGEPPHDSKASSEDISPELP